MIYIILALVCFSFLYTLYVHFLSLKAERAKQLSLIQFIAVWAGALFCVSALILYYSSVSVLDNDGLITTVGNAFYVFAFPAFIITVIVIALTVSIHFISGKLQAVRYTASHLAALLILLYTLLCSTWSHYEEIDLAAYVTMLGIGLSLACLVSPALQMHKRYITLSDTQYVNSILEKRGIKKQRRDEIIRINEKRRRLKKGNKK